MYTVDTNDGETESFLDLEDAEAYAASKPIGLITDAQGIAICGYIAGERMDKETPHAYEFKDILRPNGSLKDGSLSHHMSAMLLPLIKSWTIDKFTDSQPIQVVLSQIRKNAHEEIDRGINDAMTKI